MEVYELINPSLVIFGFVLIFTELVLGLDTLFDLVLTGLALIIAGLLALALGNIWYLGMIITIILIFNYWFFARKYLRNHISTNLVKTNSDKLIGRIGKISKLKANGQGIVKFDGEEWSVESQDKLGVDDQVEVIKIQGSILEVKKFIS